MEASEFGIMFSHFLRKLASLGSPTDPMAIRTGGFIWHPLPSASELRPLLPTLLSHPTAVVVKQNHQRTILRLTLPGGTVFVKRSRVNTPRTWAREILRLPKARLEFENTVRLRDLGIPCPEPLAWAEADSVWPGESAIVTREAAGAVPLDEWLTDSILSVERQALATELGRLFGQMHAAGVAHPDPHPGNFLVRWDNGPRFVLLDVHAVRFGPRLTWDEAKGNLVLFNRWFQLRASRADRRRFWRAYSDVTFSQGERIRDEGELGQRISELEQLTATSNRRFWAVRDDRYLGNNRQFRKVKAKGVSGHVVRELPEEQARAWLANPDAEFTQPGVVVLKDSPSATVILSRGVLWKRFRLKRPTDALKNLFRRSEALRSWVFGHGLIDRYLPTARPLFVAHRYRYGVPCQAYVAFEVVPDVVELPDFVRSARFTELRRSCESLGRLIRTLHDRGVSHRDLKAPNILLSGPNRMPVFIDLVGVAVHINVPTRTRQRDLTRLNAGFTHSLQVSQTIRLRFLRAYLGAWPKLADDWKTWWRAIADATAKKVLKNLHSGRPLA